MNVTATGFSIVCPKGTAKFSGRAASGDLPKIYIVSVDGCPIYVGVTRRAVRSRLRDGFTAQGAHGYYGYQWRHELTEANLDLWYHVNPRSEALLLDVETVEAEIVFLIRAAGQWPKYQTEIHFHPSTEVHRHVAASIMGKYDVRLLSNPVP
jgi:hypothetical protein